MQKHASVGHTTGPATLQVVFRSPAGHDCFRLKLPGSPAVPAGLGYLNIQPHCIHPMIHANPTNWNAPFSPLHQRPGVFG